MAYVNVYIDMDDFDTDDLVKELERRGTKIPDVENEFNSGYTIEELTESIYYKRRIGQKYDAELDTLIFNILGKIV